MGYRMDDPGCIHMACGLETGYTSHQFGQEAVCLAQALFFAGYTTIKPEQVIQRFNHLGAWTTTADGEGPGLLRTDRFHEAYPQITDGVQFSLVGGRWGRFNHTLLRWMDSDGEHHFDPYTGLTDYIPAGWQRDGKNVTFSITLGV